MKTIKKLVSILLAMVMVLGLTTISLAATEEPTTGTITIDNAVINQTYTIYKIFDLVSYNFDNNAYLYKVNTNWSGFFADGAEGLDYVTIDDQGYVTWKTDANVADFAKAALAYAKGYEIESVASQKASAATDTFSGLEFGCYLVDSTLGALCGLNTTNPNVTIQEKNTEPTVDKEVQEGENWGDTNDADIGDTVNFRSTITVGKGAENIVLHDKMSAGLTFNPESVAVTVNGTLVEGNNWTLRQNVTHVEGEEATTCTFDIEFNNDYIATLAEGTKIVVTYSAVLNERAVVNNPGNPNETWLDYGDNNHTVHDTTTTYTWDFNVFKYTGNDQPLAGAKFTLSHNQDGSNPIKFISKGNNEAGFPVYRVAKENEEGTTEIVTNETGKFYLEGLDSGTYWLTETEAPAGYNQLPAPIKVTIDNDGQVHMDNGDAIETETIRVENKTGSQLPETGGIGTKLFYGLGLALVLVAAVLLITKKRLSVQK